MIVRDILLTGDSMTYNLSAIIEHEGDWYVANCPELDIVSQGKSVEEAQKNLHEAVQLFLESADPKEIPPLTEPPYLTTFKVAV
jgi:predicted RNase H-like HicB family nuclease